MVCNLDAKIQIISGITPVFLKEICEKVCYLFKKDVTLHRNCNKLPWEKESRNLKK
jgi:hypothetical protein